MNHSDGTIIVVAALVLQEGRVLLARRAPFLREAGLWELPGGKLEDDESPAEALTRELREELAVDAVVEAEAFMRYRSFSSDREFDFIVLSARLSSVPTIQDSHDAIAWVHPDDLGNYALAPLDGPALKAWKDRWRFPQS